MNGCVPCRQWARRVAVRSAATTTVVTGNGMPSCSAHAAVVPGTHKAAAASTVYRQSNIIAAADVTKRGPLTTTILSSACKTCLYCHNSLILLGRKCHRATNSCDISRPRTRVICGRTTGGRRTGHTRAAVCQNFHKTSPPRTRSPRGAPSVRQVGRDHGQ